MNPSRAPEPSGASLCRVVHAADDVTALRALLPRLLPDGEFRRIIIKPNWVHHAVSPHFPIEALVTSPRLIEATIHACLEKYPGLEWITVGDVPLQSCEWDTLSDQCGLDRLAATFAGSAGGSVVTIADLRRERFHIVDGFMVPDTAPGGDPCGYREVMLDDQSCLEPISQRNPNFRVSDYDPGLTTSSHRKGFHRYLVAGSALEADLFINLPKMKTHQKAGITGALKNLVGINGQKAYLVHHRRGTPAQGGDEFSPTTPLAIRVQTRVRELLQGRSRIGFSLARQAWKAIKKTCGIRTEATRENLQAGGVYIAAGSWYGNDTIWRMIFDLNRIVRYAPAAGGRLCREPQRAYVAIIDGLVSGEGNGPLQPLPVESRLLISAADPFAADAAMARLMGYDPEKIPCIANRALFGDPAWGRFELDALPVEIDGIAARGLDALTPLRCYVPPPGWRGHIEQTPA